MLLVIRCFQVVFNSIVKDCHLGPEPVNTFDINSKMFEIKFASDTVCKLQIYVDYSTSIYRCTDGLDVRKNVNQED